MDGRILTALNRSRERQRGPLAVAADEAGNWHHWRLAVDENRLAWLELDRRDGSVNVLSSAVLEELDGVLERLQQNPPAGLVLRSGKASHFCLGADIGEFRQLDDMADIGEKLMAAHAVADRLAALSCPTIAVIHGHCLGGGLELALCCDIRLLIPGASLGLPEIRLGLHPGLGGTARLTRLVAPLAAMRLMLTGKPLPAEQALSLGLADEIVPERHLARAVRAWLSGGKPRRKRGIVGRAQRLGWLRRLAGRELRRRSAAKAPPRFYPAPNALITLWERSGDDGERMRREEIDSFSRLLLDTRTRNLIRIFFLREQMKALTRGQESSSTKGPVGHVHIIGAGTMGGDIAGWCALKGLTVSLSDRQPEMIARAVQGAAALCRRKRLTSAQTREVLDRLIPDPANSGIGRADLVIEAVPEKVELKRQVYAEVEPRMKPGALLASNTSSIPLQQLAAELERPALFLGLHFFNPVASMQLIEVVRHDDTGDESLTRACAFVGQIDRLPAPVSSAPGFLVNRVLMPYLMEAMLLVDEGLAPESIDEVARDFGMPMGPLELADQVGLDICLSVAEMLRDSLDAAMAEVPDWFRDKVERNELGRKSGQGFYSWQKGRARKGRRVAPAPDGTADRLLLPMLNACMACLSEGVIDSEELLDGALIFGTGFAPFRGGPINYARACGFSEIERSLAGLSDRLGPRFDPDPGWSRRR